MQNFEIQNSGNSRREESRFLRRRRKEEEEKIRGANREGVLMMFLI